MRTTITPGFYGPNGNVMMKRFKNALLFLSLGKNSGESKINLIETFSSSLEYD